MLSMSHLALNWERAYGSLLVFYSLDDQEIGLVDLLAVQFYSVSFWQVGMSFFVVSPRSRMVSWSIGPY